MYLLVQRATCSTLSSLGSALAEQGQQCHVLSHLSRLAAGSEAWKQQLPLPESRSHHLTHRWDKSSKTRADRPCCVLCMRTNPSLLTEGPRQCSMAAVRGCRVWGSFAMTSVCFGCLQIQVISSDRCPSTVAMLMWPIRNWDKLLQSTAFPLGWFSLVIQGKLVLQRTLEGSLKEKQIAENAEVMYSSSACLHSPPSISLFPMSLPGSIPQWDGSTLTNSCCVVSFLQHCTHLGGNKP